LVVAVVALVVVLVFQTTLAEVAVAEAVEPLFLNFLLPLLLFQLLLVLAAMVVLDKLQIQPLAMEQVAEQVMYLVLLQMVVSQEPLVQTAINTDLEVVLVVQEAAAEAVVLAVISVETVAQVA
jgi:hypothetical protein